MDKLQDNAFHVPALFLLLCVFSAVSFILGSYYQLLLLKKTSADSDSAPLGVILTGFQFLSLIGVVILSCLLAGYDVITQGKMPSLYIECFVLFAVFGGVIYRGGVRGAGMLLRRVFMLFLSCCAFLGASFAFGYVVAMMIYAAYSAFVPFEACAMVGVLCAGGAWNVPVYLLYRKIPAEQRKGMKLHHFLTPVLIAYMVLMVPLLTEQTANSEKWQDLKRNVRPIRKA